MDMGFYALDLNKLRTADEARQRKSPFEHQFEAFQALSKCFEFNGTPGKGALLVLPTGAGKTFTTIKWLGDNVISRNMKLLWLAHSFYLLDQACKELREYACWIPEPRETLNVRVVSSNPSHDSPADILPTDDVVIMTTQTAIKNLHIDALDRTGTPVLSAFRRFIEDGKRTGLFVVLDEAHHAPAYGCRNLLVSHDKDTPGLRTLAPRTNLLGLTATPTYTDETRRGWLGKIFEQGVIFSADRSKLTVEGILARPNFLPRPTGRELVVDDSLYDRLVRQHKDLPEEIIDVLANDAARNDYIVREYVENRKKYGKAIIFADRWFQCVYLKTKLEEKGVRVDAVYSHIDADPGSADARNRRTTSDNERIINEFKYGKDKKGNDTLDVLINVRMLTEGADVPSVRTVFLTRQTTSQILLAQMIGRALRGRRAGGGDEANIVMFMDEWKRLIDWANPGDLNGGLEEGRVVRGYYPLEYVSIRLVEELSKHINSGGDISLPPFARIMPIGWYQTEIVASSKEDEEPQSFTEFVMVYEHTKPKFEQYIEAVRETLPSGWDREFVPPEFVHPQVEGWVQQFFDPTEDDIGRCLDLDVARIARHLAQKLVPPQFHPFEERDRHNLDELAKTHRRKNTEDLDEILQVEFAKTGGLWKVFFKSFERFFTAVQASIRRIVIEEKYGKVKTVEREKAKGRSRVELSDNEKKQVIQRDGNKCLCCGATGKGVRLQIDHIVSRAIGGETSIENSQTLCSVCNRVKNINELNFLQTATLLRSAKPLDLLPCYNREDVRRSLMRLVNLFYHCKAVCEIRMHERRNGQFYTKWEVELFQGNDPKWLSEHKSELLRHIQEEFDCPQVKSIRIMAAK
jgi:superfamily II DNA or RNA helicase